MIVYACASLVNIYCNCCQQMICTEKVYVMWLCVCVLAHLFFGGLREKFSYPSLRRLYLIAFKNDWPFSGPLPHPGTAGAALDGSWWTELVVVLFFFTSASQRDGTLFAAPAAPSGQVRNSVASHFVKRGSDRLVGKCKCLACIR